MNLPAILRRKTPPKPVAPVVPAPPTVPPAGETDRLTVKLWPPSIDAVGAKPIAMVPWLMVMIMIVMLFGPAIQSGVGYGQRAVADLYERFISPDDEPPD